MNDPFLHGDSSTSPGAPKGPYLPEAPFSAPDVVWVLLAGVIGAAVVGGLFIGIRGVDEIGVLELSVSLMAQSVSSLLVLGYLSRTKGSGDWSRDFGLEIRVGDTWAIAAGFAVQVVAALIIAPLIELLAPENPPQQEVATITQNAEGGMSRLLLVFLIVIVAPLVEEIVFRGMLLSRLRRSMGKWSAILLSAGVFAVIHLLDPNAILAVPGLFLVGVVLAWLALRTGDLSVPIFAHVGINLTGALVLIFGPELVEDTEAGLGLLGFLLG